MRSLSARSSRRLLVVALLAGVSATGLIQSAARAAGMPPPQPLNLGVTANPGTSLALNWDPTPGATSYKIYRGTSPGGEAATPIATTTSTVYTDSGLSGTPIYYYEVTAVNSAGESARSAEDCSKVNMPTGTGGNTPGVASGSSLVFYAKDALLNGFDYFITLPGWFPQVLGSSGAVSPGHVAVDMAYAAEGTMAFNDVVVPTSGLYTIDWRYAFATGLFPGVNDREMVLTVNGTVITSTERFPVTGSFETYHDSTIQVHLNAGKNSIELGAKDGHGVSRVDTMTVTPATASVPTGPTNLTATAATGSVALHWTASSSGAPTSYSIWRGSKSYGEATTPVATVSGTTTSYTDTTVTNSSSYWYMVTANNATGGSPDSNEVEATPGVTFPSGTNLALNQDAYASSIDASNHAATNATDGSFNTRWQSAGSDPQWLMVDLGATHTINTVVLAWQSSYAKAFQIQTSNDAQNWTTIYSTTTGTGGTQTLSVTGSGRYIRIYCTVRASATYGSSLWEFGVYGT